jgi:hypothetical protein
LILVTARTTHAKRWVGRAWLADVANHAVYGRDENRILTFLMPTENTNNRGTKLGSFCLFLFFCSLAHTRTTRVFVDEFNARDLYAV